MQGSWEYPQRQRACAPGDGVLREASAGAALALAPLSVSGAARGGSGAVSALDILAAWRRAQGGGGGSAQGDAGGDACDCLAAGCGARFVGAGAGVAAARHARSVHLWACAAAGCGLAFLTSREASLHSEEAHSPLFAALAERQDMYACWVDGCTRRTRTAGARWQHLLTVHRLPPEHAGPPPAPAAAAGATATATAARCRFFSAPGGCMRGAACRYAHVARSSAGCAAGTGDDVEMAAPAPAPIARGEPPRLSAVPVAAPSFGRRHAQGLARR